MSTPSNTAPPVGKHPWLVLVLVALAQLMVVLDSTIVNIALPSAQQDLGFGNDSRQWIVTAYALAFGSLLLLGGRLSDIFGRKPIFIIGLIGFAAASALGGAADSFGLLVVARALQGVFGALLAPAALGILTTTFTDPKERGKAFGVFGAVAGSGAAVGLLLGGVLTEFASWRWCLYVNIVFAIIGVIGSFILLNKQPRAATRARIDVPGVLTVTLGLVGVVYGFSNAEVNGWGDFWTIFCLAAGVILLVAFVFIQSRVAHPLLPLRVILNRDRGGAYLVLGLMSIGMFAVFLFLTYYMTGILGYTSLQSGFAFLPMPLSIMISASQIGARLLPRVGPRLLIFTGALVAAVGMALLTRIDLDSSYAGVVLPGLVVMGLGLGLIFSSAMNIATAGVQRQDAGVASATVNTMQQIGGAIGTALLSTLSASAVTAYITANGTSAIAQANAQLSGYHLAFWVSTGIFVIVAIIGGTVIERHTVRKNRVAEQGVDVDAAPAMAH